MLFINLSKNKRLTLKDSGKGEEMINAFMKIKKRRDQYVNWVKFSSLIKVKISDIL